MDKYLLSVSEVSKRYGLGRDRLYSLIKSEPDLPIVQVGGITKFNGPMLEAWIDKITIEGRKI